MCSGGDSALHRLQNLGSDNMFDPVAKQHMWLLASQLTNMVVGSIPWFNVEGSRPEWCISSMIYSGDTPFWSETLDMFDLVAKQLMQLLASQLTNMVVGSILWFNMFDLVAKQLMQLLASQLTNMVTGLTPWFNMFNPVAKQLMHLLASQLTNMVVGSIPWIGAQ